MTRKKVKLAFISNDSSRKATFKKKVNELSTLCGIRACAIIYSPYDTNPEVWPSNSNVERIVSEFRTLRAMDQHKKMVDQETFLKERIAKVTEQLRRHRKENMELEMTEVMFHSLAGNMGMFHLSISDLNDLGYLIEQYLKDINRRIEFFQNSGMKIGESSNAVVAASEGIGSIAVVASTTAPTSTINEVVSSSSAMVLCNPLQQKQHHQQFRHPAAPHVGFYEQHRNLNLNLNQNHNQSQQQLFMEMMNHTKQPSYAAEQMGFPFIDDNHHNHNHHYHHHQPQQQQQIPVDRSTAPAASSSSIIPITSPNPTNNIWFR